MIHTLHNDRLRVGIDDHGGTLHEILDLSDGKHILWQGDSASWTGRDVVIFPFVGRMRDGWYTHDGVRYEMPIHGVCTDAQFEVVQTDDTRCVLRLRSNADTRAVYPFDWELTVTRSLQGNTLSTCMQVTNCGEQEMYYGMGAHPAFALPAKETQESTDTSGNYLEWEGECPDRYYPLQDGKFLLPDAPFAPCDRLELNKALMQKYATLLWTGKHLPRRYTLVRADGKRVAVETDPAAILGLWSHPERGAYMCIEPWLSSPDFADAPRELKEKPLIRALAPKQSIQYRFDITVQ